MKLQIKRIILTVFVCLMSLNLASCMTVEPGNVGVKSTLGGLKSEPLQPGVHIAVPGLDSYSIYSTRTVALPEEFAALTRDGQSVKITGIVEYSIDPMQAPNIFKKIGFNSQDVEKKVITPVLLSAVKVQVANQDLGSIIGDQNGLSDEIATNITGQLKQSQYVSFGSFRVTGVVLDAEVQASIEQKQIAKQQLERKTTEVEIAKKEVERLNVLKTGISELTIKQDFVNKWDGKTPIGGNLLINGTK